MTTRVIACRLPNAEVERLHRLAAQRGTTLSDELRSALRKHLTPTTSPSGS